MVDVEEKRDRAKDWMIKHVEGIGENVAERFVEEYVDEDTKALIEIIEGNQNKLHENVAYCPNDAEKNLRDAYRRDDAEDPIAPIADIDLLYMYGKNVYWLVVAIDPDINEIEEEWTLLYASEKGLSKHTSANI